MSEHGDAEKPRTPAGHDLLAEGLQLAQEAVIGSVSWPVGIPAAWGLPRVGPARTVPPGVSAADAEGIPGVGFSLRGAVQARLSGLDPIAAGWVSTVALERVVEVLAGVLRDEFGDEQRTRVLRRMSAQHIVELGKLQDLMGDDEITEVTDGWDEVDLQRLADEADERPGDEDGPR